jgi:hypothetical protein
MPGGAWPLISLAESFAKLMVYMSSMWKEFVVAKIGLVCAL